MHHEAHKDITNTIFLLYNMLFIPEIVADDSPVITASHPHSNKFCFSKLIDAALEDVVQDRPVYEHMLQYVQSKTTFKCFQFIASQIDLSLYWFL